MVLNKLDDFLAPNLCLFTLLVFCILQLILLISVENIFLIYLISSSISISVIFTIKVFMVGNERKRVYRIVKDRLLKKGYDKAIFDSKCVSICQLTQATYIAFRYNSVSDFSYFCIQHRKKIPQYVMEDEALEKILNNIDYSNIKDGQIIHEYTKQYQINQRNITTLPKD